MTITFIKIRCLQLYRTLAEFGIFRLLFFLFLLSLVGYVLYQICSIDKNTNITLGGMALILSTVHISRKDKHFLSTLLRHPIYIYWSEYLALSIPLLTLWAYNLNWQGCIGILFLVIVIPWLIPNAAQSSFLNGIFYFVVNPINSRFGIHANFRIPFVSPLSFEWISGIRRIIVVLVPVYLITLSFAFKPLVAPIGIMILSLLISGIYYEGESREFIEVYANSERKFLSKKIKLGVLNFIGMTIPIIALGITFQYSTWIYIAYSIIASSLIQIITIIFKYSLFFENSNLNKNGTIIGINIIGILIPIIWPLPLIMGSIHYRKALKKLKPYFNAEN